jgi:hypothetical protein
MGKITLTGAGEVDVRGCSLTHFLLHVDVENTALIEDNELQDAGIVVTGMSDACIKCNHCNSSGIWVRGAVTATIARNDLSGVAGSAIAILDNAEVTVANNWVEDSRHGIRVGGGARARIEENTILRNIFSGINVSDTAIVDLGGGPLNSAGRNMVIGTSKGKNIIDYRTAGSGPIYAEENSWEDPVPTGSASGPVNSYPNYYIRSEGNSVIFSES